LLSLLARRIDRAGWVVKGGVNLRAWFGSRRYSEDLDIDAVRGQPHVLEEKVDKLLESRPFVDLLATQALSLARSSKPKQTETTQRWKFEIHAHKFPVPLHTRVEFSRRGSREEEYVLEPVRPEIVRPYGLLAPTVYHYTARSAVRQKIQALVSRAETQARDVWDLDHLLRTTGADPRPLPAVLRRTLDEAIARVTALSFDVFKAQIVPYLTAADQELYGTPDAWARMCELVAGRLAELKDV
jgi:predicted nucleotidyltransferase component of viral defense system